MNGNHTYHFKYSSGCYEYSESYVIHFINLQWITFSGLLIPRCANRSFWKRSAEESVWS